MLTTTVHGLADDLGRGLGPHEQRGVFVLMHVVGADLPDEPSDRGELPAAHGLGDRDTTPFFYHVQPRGSSRGEVEAHVGVRLETVAHFGRGDLGREPRTEDSVSFPTGRFRNQIRSS